MYINEGVWQDDVRFLFSSKSRILVYDEKASLGLRDSSLAISRPQRNPGQDSRAVFHGDASAACSPFGINAIRS